jgi:hypothetical protein
MLRYIGLPVRLAFALLYVVPLLLILLVFNPEQLTRSFFWRGEMLDKWAWVLGR